jgi:hypothetical protein
MIVRLFDIQNGKVIPSEHSYTLNFLRAIRENYDEELVSAIFAYCFYMTCPNPDLNPFFNVPETDKEDLIRRELRTSEDFPDFDPDDMIIKEALEMCRKLYETPTSRAYRGISSMLDRLALYMEKTPIEHGRDGNITAIVNAAAKFEQIRSSFRGAYNDLIDEQKSSVRGGQGLSYDQI